MQAVPHVECLKCPHILNSVLVRTDHNLDFGLNEFKIKFIKVLCNQPNHDPMKD